MKKLALLDVSDAIHLFDMQRVCEEVLACGSKPLGTMNTLAQLKAAQDEKKTLTTQKDDYVTVSGTRNNGGALTPEKDGTYKKSDTVQNDVNSFAPKAGASPISGDELKKFDDVNVSVAQVEKTISEGLKNTETKVTDTGAAVKKSSAESKTQIETDTQKITTTAQDAATDAKAKVEDTSTAVALGFAGVSEQLDEQAKAFLSGLDSIAAALSAQRSYIDQQIKLVLSKIPRTPAGK